MYHILRVLNQDFREEVWYPVKIYKVFNYNQ